MADYSVRGARWWVVALPTALACIMSANFSSAQTCDSQDSAALLEFKAGFVDRDGVFAGWNGTADCCSWQGVTCELGRVVELKVMAFFSSGSPVRDTAYAGGQVGASLGALTALTQLDIENVRFNGPIPDSLGDLGNLERLKLRQAGLQGLIPESLCNLSKLQVLDLTDNAITGNVPACVTEWTQIAAIRLAANELSGAISENISQLITLVELDLAENGFEGYIPRSLQKLQKLEILSLSANSLNGSIPSALTGLKSLQVVALDHNQLTGGVSSWWYRLENLTQIELNDNQLGGNIYLPGSTEALAPLQKLSLQNNKFGGTIPPELGNFVGAVAIDLSNNQLTGPIPDSLGNNTFGTLLLSNNRLTGGFPLSLARLQTVRLDGNQLDDLTAIGSVPTDGFNVISELGLGENRLAGPWPTWISELVNLSTLDVSSNNISGPIPVALLSSQNLQYSLNASHNPLNIPLPGGVGFVSQLGILDLTATGLTGSLGASFFKSFPLVSSLYLGENALVGDLPFDLPAMLNPSTNILDLSNNFFTGKVPRFFNLEFLMYLDLVGNSFAFGPLLDGSEDEDNEEDDHKVLSRVFLCSMKESGLRVLSWL
ncbi:hypothetical protein AXG93_725s1380 [Marchantia polymorpha subsp. ruderalis]|uniref:Uncharacterized protein n=3 Tax=Marchantia polymorpha TaxID=3197 RepID=A0A176WDX8_MARPO|nr:hypothetical protein AXG93_725s1380 [Marchantia polymorpha subsp. ruderalis]